MDASAARKVAQQVAKLHRASSRLPFLTLDLFTPELKLRFPQAASPLPHEWPFVADRKSGRDLAKSGFTTSWNHSTVRGLYMRHLSQLISTANGGKRVLFVDTLALVRRLESQGLTEKQSEAITEAIIEVLNDSMENVAQGFVSKTDKQKNELMQEAALSKFKGDIQSSQEYKVSSLQRETEKLRTDIEKLRSEMRYEIDKVIAGQRLDLNLERGRMREELANQNAETSNLTNKLDREIHALKTQVEAAKYEVIKYCIGTVVSVAAVGLGLLRILM